MTATPPGFGWAALPRNPPQYAGFMPLSLAEATARDGKPYKNTYSWYMQMRDGMIVNVVAFFDTIEFTDFWNRVEPQ